MELITPKQKRDRAKEIRALLNATHLAIDHHALVIKALAGYSGCLGDELVSLETARKSPRKTAKRRA
jgi:predicted nucleic-acid-binding protein